MYYLAWGASIPQGQVAEESEMRAPLAAAQTAKGEEQKDY